ncbi:hypothetical protein [Streptomyces sp. NPDC018584]
MISKGRQRYPSGEEHWFKRRPDSMARGETWWSEARRKSHRVHRGDNWSTTKLSDAAVVEIRRRWAAKEARQKDMAEEYGVSKSLINLICNGKARKKLPIRPQSTGGNIGGPSA